MQALQNPRKIPWNTRIPRNTVQETSKLFDITTYVEYDKKTIIIKTNEYIQIYGLNLLGT